MAKAGRQAGRGGGKGCAAERYQKAAPGSAVRGQQQLELTTLRNGSWPGWSCSVLAHLMSHLRLLFRLLSGYL